MSQKPQQRTVRAGALENRLSAQNEEIGQKVGILLSEYHTRYVEPRLAALEQPWYRRAWAWLRDRGSR